LLFYLNTIFCVFDSTLQLGNKYTLQHKPQLQGQNL